MEPNQYEHFLEGLKTLTTIPSRQSEPADVAALEQAWWPELEDRRWIDGDLWLRAVRDAQTFCTFRPSLAEMLAVCEQVALEREAAREAAAVRALPAPAHEGDPSTTPEERERWAREDAFIRGHMPGVLREWEQSAYLDDWSPYPGRPGVWVRTAPEDMAGLARSKQADLALFAVLRMTPEQRRARDRRIAAEKARAAAAVARLTGRIGSAVETVERTYRSLRPGERRVVRIEWNRKGVPDGETETEVRRPLDPPPGERGER